MITELGEVFGGVSGGKRGFLRLNSNVSLPLRYTFWIILGNWQLRHNLLKVGKLCLFLYGSVCFFFSLIAPKSRIVL
ncbi:MAG: hypothetical protein PHP73_00980 [Candidatus Omnitrophica bacterium]|nr:hypothetical protein [Candidatus Omnitrophota bacterium]